MNKRALGLAILVLLLSAVLRFINLNALPIFADESIYVRWSQVMRAEPSLRFLPLSDGKQPLFMWATIPMFKLIADPLLAARVLSGLSGLGTTIGVGLLAYLLFKKTKTALLAATIWAVLPYAVFFERMALADAMLNMFLVWGVIFFLLSIKHLRLDMAMLSGFAFGFAWLSKSPAMFGLILLPSLFIFLPNLKKLTLIKALGFFVVTFVISFGMYNILRLGPEFHMIAIRNLDYVYPLSEVLTHPLDPLVPHLKDSAQFYFYLLTPIGLLFVIWGLFDGRHLHWRERGCLGLWLLAPIFIECLIARAFTAQYIFFTVPFAAILIAHALEHLGQHSQKAVLSYAGLIVIMVSALWLDILFLTNPDRAPLPRIERSGYLEDWTAGQGIKEVSSYIEAAALKGSVLVGSEGFLGTPFDGLQLYLNGSKNVRVIGVGVWIDEVSDKLTNALVDNQVFLVVNSTRFHILEPEKEGLELIASYPKSLKPNGIREYLLFFKVLNK